MTDHSLEEGQPVKISLARRLRNYLFTGILVTAPAALTIYLAVLLVTYIDSKVVNLLPEQYNPNVYLPYGIPGLGVIIMLVFFVVIGWFATGLVGRFFIKFWEKLITSTPIVSGIYKALKQIFETFFSSSSKRSFQEVVLIEYPRRGLWTIAFITSEPAKIITDTTGDTDMISVYVPTTPNPTSGFLLFVPTADVHKLDISVEEGLKYVISVGIVPPISNSDKAKLDAEKSARQASKAAKKLAKAKQKVVVK